MEKINFTGMTGAQAFRAIDANGGVNDDDISAHMKAWAHASWGLVIGDAQFIAAVRKLGNASASYAATIAGHLQNCTEFDQELISEAAEQLMLQDQEVKCMGEKIKTLEAELKESDEMLKKIADLCKMHERRWEFLHTPNTDEQGYEWSVMRVKYKDGNLVDALNTLSDLLDLDAEIGRVHGFDVVHPTRKVEKKIPEKARSISDDMMDVVDRLGGEWADVDP